MANPPRLPVAILVALLFCGIDSLGQHKTPVTGSVVSGDGTAIEGVTVYGSKKKCCPVTPETTKTDKDGRFRLEHPGAVIHFFKEGLKPVSLLIGLSDSNLRVNLVPSTDDLVVPTCQEPPRGSERIGWGDAGLQFGIPKKGFRVKGGKPDADYVRYVIHPKTGRASLRLWFGPLTMNLSPDDEQFVTSRGVSQRNVLNSSRRMVGLDSRGEKLQGGFWRYTSVVDEGGAIYDEATGEDAALFDRIIESVCRVPYPPR